MGDSVPALTSLRLRKALLYSASLAARFIWEGFEVRYMVLRSMDKKDKRACKKGQSWRPMRFSLKKLSMGCETRVL